MDVKDISGEVSDENEKHVIRNGREVAINDNTLTELCSSVLWKLELPSSDNGY